MSADQWTHHDPAVRDLIRRAQADATARAEAAEAKVALVQELVDEDAKLRAGHYLTSDCGCSTKDCYECGKWCRCNHTPYAYLRAALADEGDTHE